VDEEKAMKSRVSVTDVWGAVMTFVLLVAMHEASRDRLVPQGGVTPVAMKLVELADLLRGLW
jgi:hypothetical protein